MRVYRDEVVFSFFPLFCTARLSRLRFELAPLLFFFFFFREVSQGSGFFFLLFVFLACEVLPP